MNYLIDVHHLIARNGDRTRTLWFGVLLATLSMGLSVGLFGCGDGFPSGRGSNIDFVDGGVGTDGVIHDVDQDATGDTVSATDTEVDASTTTEADTVADTAVDVGADCDGNPVAIAIVTPNKGPVTGGSIVVIVGAGFESGVKVTFGGKLADVLKVQFRSRMVVRTPPGKAGLADITITNEEGSNTTRKGGYTYQQITSKGPSLSQLSPNTGPTTGGTVALVTGANLQPDAVFMLDWETVKASLVTSKKAAQLTTAPLAPGGYDLAVMNPDGQAAVLKSAFTAVSPSSLGLKPSFGTVYPAAGGIGGGMLVTVTGTNFDTLSALMLGGEVVDSWSVKSATKGSFTTPKHDAGMASLVLTNPDGQSALKTAGFLYYIDMPVVFGVVPSSGPMAGGTDVIIQGDFFAPQLVVTIGGQPCTGVQVNAKGTQATCKTFAAQQAGPAAVLVTNPDGLMGNLPAAFTYVAPPPKPEVLAVQPTTAALDGGMIAVISGKAFRNNSEVFFGAVAAKQILGVSPTAISVVVPKVTSAGKVDVTVKALGGPDATLIAGFEYITVGPPVIQEAVPNSGPTTGGIVIVIKGKNLRPKAEVWFGGKKAQTSYVLGPQGLGVLLPKGIKGTTDITLKTPGFPDTKLKLGFTYKAPADANTGVPKMALAQVSPASGPLAGGHWAVLRGVNFPTGVKVFFGGKPAAKVVVIGGRTLSVRVPAGDKLGPVDVMVQDPTNLIAATANAAYAYVDSKNLGPAPKIIAIKPAIGPSIGGTLARVDGLNLLSSGLFFIGGKPAAAVLTMAGGKVASFRSPAGKPGAASVMWVNPDGQYASFNGTFVYTSGGNSPVSITAVKPSQGTSSGGSQVALTGKGFSPGSLVFMGGEPVSALLEGPTAMSAISPAHSAGLVDVSVTTTSGWTATLKASYNFILESPFVATLTPNWGKPAGGTKVVIVGQGFHSKAKVLFGSNPAKVLSATNGTLTVEIPAGTLGKVAVTVTNPDFLTNTLQGGFLYANTEPGKEVTIGGISPDTASKVGGSTHIIHGSGFGPGTTVILGSTLAKNIKLIDARTVQFDAPALPVGAHNVKVVVPAVGDATRNNAFFTWNPASAGPTPQLKAVLPGLGPIEGGTVALLRVFPAPAKAKIFFGGSVATVLGADETGALVLRTPAHAAGAVNVSVMFPSGRAHTLVDAFNYYKPAAGVKVPVLTQLKPSSGASAGGEAVTFFGQNFASGTMAFLGYRPLTKIQIKGTSAVLGTTPAHPQGLVNAAITRPDGFSAETKGAYSYKVPAPEPKVVFPTVGFIDGGSTVAISGKYFASGAKVFFGKIVSTKVKVAASGVLTALVPPSAKAGKVDIRVLNPDGQQGSLAQSFTYAADNYTKPAPKIAKLVPDRGPFQGGTVLVVWGSNFQIGARVLIGGKPAMMHVVTAGYATITTPAGFIGPADVTVLNPDGQGQTQGAAFTWNSPSAAKPKLLGITPPGGPEVGGTAVILTGADFAGAGMGFVGYRPLSSWTVLNSAIATGSTIGGSSGKIDVTVTNGDGQSATLIAAFDMVGAPKIDSFNPDIGATAGGSLITIAGKNFSNKAQVFFGGKEAQNVQVLSPYVIKATTPVSPAGPAQVRVLNPDGQSHTAKKPYLFVVPPQITSIFPPKGSAAGGTPVIVRGKFFLSGAVVYFGKTKAANLVRISDTILTVRSPKGVAGGAVAIRVDNPDGQSALGKQSFAYLDPSKIAPPAKLIAVRPSKGPISGGTWGLLKAVGLQSGAQLMFGVVPAVRTTVLKGGKEALFVTAASPVTATVDVVLLQPDGGFSILKSAFSYTDPKDLGAKPAIANIDPFSGPTKGGSPVTFTGAGLDPKGLVFFDGLPSPLVTKATNGIRAITPSHKLGSVDVVHTNADGWSVLKKQAFNFVPPPTLVSLNPKAGPAAGGTTVTLSGTFFATGLKNSAFGSKTARVMFCTHFVNKTNCIEVPTSQIEVKNAKTVIIKTPKQVPGLSDVAVINPDGQTAVLNQAFLFRPPPKIVGIQPNSGSTLGSQIILVTGSGFQSGASVRFANVVAKKVTVVDSTKLQVVTPPGKPGLVAVTVANPDLSTHTIGGGFLYISPPEITNIFPTIGPETGGTVVTVQGANFVKGVAGSKVFLGNKQIDPKNVQIPSAGIIKFKTPSGTGPVAVKIVNPDKQYALKAGGFVYVPKVLPPSVSHLTPKFAGTAGGIQVSIYGSQFLTGAQVSFGNPSIGYKSALSTKVLNGGTLILAQVPAHLPGKVDVRVTNSDGQAGTLKNGFEYLAALGLPALAFQGVTPKRGPNAGGYDVVVYGQGFKAGVKVYFGSADTATWVVATKLIRLGPTLLRVTVPKWPKYAVVDMRVVNPALGGKADTLIARKAFSYGQSVILEPKGHRLPLDRSHGDQVPLIIDADGDGLNDVMITHSSGRDDLFLQVKNAKGEPGYFMDASSQMPDTKSSCRYRRLPIVADIDGDKDQDVIFIGSNYYLCIYRNVGGGSFKLEQKFYDPEFYQGNQMVLADVTCDGIADLIVARSGFNRIYVGDGKGGFKKNNKLLPAHNETSLGVAVADVDKDGDNDLLIGNNSAQQNRMYYNSCNNVAKGQPGSFSDATYGNKMNFPVSGFDTQKVAFADINGDGWPDAFLWNWGQTDRIYLNQGGNFLPDDGLRFPQDEKEARSGGGEFVDVDGDGDLDVVTRKYYGKYWPLVYLNDKAQGGPGRFVAAPSNMPQWRGEDVSGIAIGDLNGDKLPDFFIARTNNQDWLMLNQGYQSNKARLTKNRVSKGSWTNSTLIGIPPDINDTFAADIGDIDGDGDLDIVLASANLKQGVDIWINDGAGNFFSEGSVRVPDVNCNARQIKLVDLNKDGDLDIIMACYYYNPGGVPYSVYGRSGGPRQLVNDGKGYFKDVSKQYMPAAYSGWYSTDITFGDLDGDGDLDVFVASYLTGQNLVLINGGDPFNLGGAFFFNKTATLFSWNQYYSYGVLLIDLNNDKQVDLYLGRNGQNQLFHNVGKGKMKNVTVSHLSSASDNTSRVLAADVDGDGDIDLFSVSNGVNHLSISELAYKYADVTASHLPTKMPARNSTGGVMVDLDLDGLLDVMTTTWGGPAQLMLNVGNAHFGDFSSSMPAENDYSRAVLTADFDGDGRPDLFIANSGVNRIYLNKTPKSKK